jgi:hypothetical protein
VAKGGGKFEALVRARGDDHHRGREDHRPDNDAVRAEGGGVGKRSNAEYRQVSAYIRKDTHRKVKIALLEEDQEFSELVGRLLEEWLDTRS